MGWVPQRERILDAATRQDRQRRNHLGADQAKKGCCVRASAEVDDYHDEEQDQDDDEDAEPRKKGDTPVIDYQMEHRPWFFPWYKHSVEYDFSPTTIQFLMSALKMLNAPKEGEQAPLELKFRNSLLLPLQQVIELYTLCQDKQIKIDSIKGGNKNHIQVECAGFCESACF